MVDLIYIFNKRLNDHGKYWRHVYKVRKFDNSLTIFVL
jgi:hypothetical protein